MNAPYREPANLFRPRYRIVRVPNDRMMPGWPKVQDVIDLLEPDERIVSIYSLIAHSAGHRYDRDEMVLEALIESTTYVIPAQHEDPYPFSGSVSSPYRGYEPPSIMDVTGSITMVRVPSDGTDRDR